MALRLDAHNAPSGCLRVRGQDPVVAPDIFSVRKGTDLLNYSLSPSCPVAWIAMVVANDHDADLVETFFIQNVVGKFLQAATAKT